MSNLIINLHPLVEQQLMEMVKSADKQKVKAAAQLLQLIMLIEALPAVRERLLTHFEKIEVDNGKGERIKVDIKLIQELKHDASDTRYQTDAIRRIRDLSNWPATNYRVFFAPRKKLNGSFRYDVLGVFHKETAYSKETLEELRRRY